MPEMQPIVFVIDDNPSFRRSTERLLCSAGFQVQAFGSAQEFLQAKRPDAPACVVLDVQMPGLSGLDLQQEMLKASLHLPVIFMTAHGDIRMAVQAMKAGAVEFLTKPCREQELLDAIAEAIRGNCATREGSARLACLQARYELLTPREREVMAGVVSGMLNKQIAADLGTTEKTIKFHRAHIMHKLEVISVADLVKMAGQLQSPPASAHLAHA